MTVACPLSYCFPIHIQSSENNAFFVCMLSISCKVKKTHAKSLYSCISYAAAAKYFTQDQYLLGWYIVRPDPDKAA